MRHLFRNLLFLSSTNQPVVDADAAVPRALRSAPTGHTRIIIRQPNGGISVQLVKNSKLTRVATPLTRSFNRLRASL